MMTVILYYQLNDSVSQPLKMLKPNLQCGLFRDGDSKKVKTAKCGLSMGP